MGNEEYYFILSAIVGLGLYLGVFTLNHIYGEQVEKNKHLRDINDNLSRLNNNLESLLNKKSKE